MAPRLAAQLEAYERERQVAQQRLQTALDQKQQELEEQRNALEQQVAALKQELITLEEAHTQQVHQLQVAMAQLEPACHRAQLQLLHRKIATASASVIRASPTALPVILTLERDPEEEWFAVRVILPLPPQLAQLWNMRPDFSGTLALAAAAAFGETAAALDPVPAEYDCQPCAGALLMELTAPHTATTEPQVLVEVLVEELFRQWVEAGRRAHIIVDEVLELVPIDTALFNHLAGDTL